MKPPRPPTSIAFTIVLLSAVAAGIWAGVDRVNFDLDDAWGLEGFYPVEHDRSGAGFRWSRPRSLIHFRGIDRTQGFRLTLEVRCWRPERIAPPLVSAEIDSKLIWEQALQNEWQELTLGAGPVGGDHLDLVLETTPFRPADVIPGSEDKRSLGLELRRVQLEVPSNLALWLILCCGTVLVVWCLLGTLGTSLLMRAAWTIAALISAFTIGIATLRPYLFDASPEWTTSVFSASILVFVLFPFFFSTGRGEPSRAIAVLALGGCIFAVYARALENGFFWDDFTFARTISFSEWLYTFYGSWNWTGIGNDYYRPLTVTLRARRL